MSFPAYSAYQDSGIPWVGEVPIQWDRKPLFALVRELDDRNDGMKEDNLLSLSYGQIKRKNIDDNDGLLPASFETYQIVERDDVVWRLTDLQNDQRSLRTGIVRERGIITSAYLATRPLAVMPEFLAYLLRAYDLTKVFYSMGGGLRQSMKFSDVKWLPVMLPSPAEQTAIAAFLDRETAKIDALVAEQERLIALLKEKRQAVISHAVTKGLNPNAPMKDSGIEWLGEIPAHWDVMRLKHIGEAITGLTYSPEDVVPGGGILVLRSSNVQNGKVHLDDNVYVSAQPSMNLMVQPNDILVCSRNGSRALIGKNAILTEDHIGMTWGAFMTVFRSKMPRWAFWVLNSEIFAQQSSTFLTATINQLTIGNFYSMSAPVPPADEQRQIDQILTEATEQLGALIAEAQSAITLLQERRAALISAAVTGKIDVRRLAETSQELELA